VDILRRSPADFADLAELLLYFLRKSAQFIRKKSLFF